MKDLAYRFIISQSSVTNIFHEWLNVLYTSLGWLVLVKWPETDEWQLPEVFQNEVFRKVKCVIDCTEIFIERSSNLKARAQTYSYYKRHTTIKILVGISPCIWLCDISVNLLGRPSEWQTDYSWFWTFGQVSAWWCCVSRQRFQYVGWFCH